MTHTTDYAIAGALVLIGVALTAVAPASHVLHAAGLLCVAGGGFWLGATVRDGSDDE